MMKCQNCGENNANISYTRIINGEKTELHLCSECAKEMNINFNFNIGLNDIFTNFFDDFQKVRSFVMPELTRMSALESGWDDWENDDCAESLFFPWPKIEIMRKKPANEKDELDEVLNQIQKKHQKKERPEEKRAQNNVKENKVLDKKQQEIAKLKDKIQEYIQKEEYEKAAVLRDKIKELEK